MAKSFIVRIYRCEKLDQDGAFQVIGLVESADGAGSCNFSNMEELWEALKSPEFYEKPQAKERQEAISKARRKGII